jgi:thiol-disulfide isomerase/thioredoxin
LNIRNFELPETLTCLIITANWSPISLLLVELIQQLVQEYGDKIRFLHWDYDELGSDLRERYDIKAVPLIRLIQEQQTAFQQYGGHLSKAEIKGLIYSYLEC